MDLDDKANRTLDLSHLRDMPMQNFEYINRFIFTRNTLPSQYRLD